MGKKATTADLERRLDEIVAELKSLEDDAKAARHIMVGNINMALSWLYASQK